MSEAEDQYQMARLRAGVGDPGSGAVRYSAAMYFYARGQMPADLLEIYRCCLRQDNEDPIDLAKFKGVFVPAKFDG